MKMEMNIECYSTVLLLSLSFLYCSIATKFGNVCFTFNTHNFTTMDEILQMVFNCFITVLCSYHIRT